MLIPCLYQSRSTGACNKLSGGSTAIVRRITLAFYRISYDQSHSHPWLPATVPGVLYHPFRIWAEFGDGIEMMRCLIGSGVVASVTLLALFIFARSYDRMAGRV